MRIDRTLGDRDTFQQLLPCDFIILVESEEILDLDYIRGCLVIIEAIAASDEVGADLELSVLDPVLEDVLEDRLFAVQFVRLFLRLFTQL